MVDLQVATATGIGSTLKQADVDEFRASLRGVLICPEDEGYDEARKVWNGMVDKHPAAIARCSGVGDVINSVNFARTRDLVVSVRCGGHNFPGNSVCNGGLTIDLSPMKGIRVDPAHGTVRAEGGVKWGEFDHETQALGLATPGGTDADTGIGGLTLGGGMGWLSGKYGLSCDNLVSVDLVTAQGQLLTASAKENPDLFWAVRGGGGNFGIVTSFEYQLHPVGPTVLAGFVYYPFEKAEEFLRFYGDFSSKIPDEINTIGVLGTSPEGTPRGAIGVCYHGPIEAGEEALRPMREFGPPLLDNIQPRTYVQAQNMVAPLTPPGRQYYIKAHFMKEIAHSAIDPMVAQFKRVTSPYSVMMFQQLGNASNRVASHDTSFSFRHARYEWVALAAWDDPGESEIHIKWARDFSEVMQPFTFGAYVNQLGTEADEGAAGIRSAYGDNYGRLAALKNKYDPTNLFSHNQNIRPTI